jgi:hypothetical protein
MPGRAEAALAAAALGTVLLTTAVMQPLLPLSLFSPADRTQVMSRGWQAVIVASLVTASAAAVLWGWRHRPVTAVILASALGLAGLLVNIFIIHRAISVADLMTRRINWYAYAPLFVLPFLACAALILIALARERRFASGVLLATGAVGYVFYFQTLVVYLSNPLPHPAPGRAMFAGMLGSAVILAAGMAARGDDPGYRPKAGRAALLVTVAAALAVVAASFYGWAAYLGPSSAPGYGWRLISGFVVFVLTSAILAAGACTAVAGRRYPDRRVAAGVLIAGGFLALVYFLDSHVFEWLIPVSLLATPPGPATISGDIGVAAGLAFLLTGAGLALVRSAARPAGEVMPSGRPPDSGLASSETTRHLCIAAHVDDQFTRKVITKIVTDSRRALVPSMGMDLGTVLSHCLAARRRQIIRDTLITALLLAALPLLLDLHTRTGLRDLVVLLALAATVALAERWLARYRVGIRQLSKGRFDPARRPSLTAVEQRRLAELLAYEHGNLSVYGPYSPFAGSGFWLGGWSFALNTGRGAEQLGGRGRLTPISFDVADLYAAVRQDIQALELAGVMIENRLLADGRSVTGDEIFTRDGTTPPVTEISADLLSRLMHAPDPQNRVYQCVRMQDWRGDLVLSVFVNFTKRGTGLLAEVQHFVLAPVKEQYRQLDLLAGRSAGRRLRGELRDAPGSSVAALAKAPFHVIGAAWRAGLHGGADSVSARQNNDADSECNIGAFTSVRELGQSNVYRKYFQQVDRDLSTKLIDRQVLDTITTFLDAHNIDTSQFDEQRATILNQGLLISGGEFHAGSVAVGQHARARTTTSGQGVRARQGRRPRG